MQQAEDAPDVSDDSVQALRIPNVHEERLASRPPAFPDAVLLRSLDLYQHLLLLLTPLPAVLPQLLPSPSPSLLPPFGFLCLSLSPSTTHLTQPPKPWKNHPAPTPEGRWTFSAGCLKPKVPDLSFLLPTCRSFPFAYYRKAIKLRQWKTN